MKTYRDVIGFNGYQVSSCGEIINKHGRVLSAHKTRRGYMTTNLGYGRNVKVHRIVALAWVPNPFCHPQVNHIDGDKTNNAASNLEWVSGAQNMAHAFASGLHPNPEKAVVGVCMNTGAGIWAKSQHAVNHFGFKYRNVNDCLKGRAKTHKGYVWSYA